MYQIVGEANEKATTNIIFSKSDTNHQALQVEEGYSKRSKHKNTGDLTEWGADFAAASDMSGEHNNSDQSQDAALPQGAPQPPPFNPITVHVKQQTAVGTSVVPDLMKVYESMTQSSTPQEQSTDANFQHAGHDPYHSYPQGAPPVAQHQAAQHQAAHQQAAQHQAAQHHQGGYYPHDPQQSHFYPAPHGTASYQGSGTPIIPPVPDYPATAEEQPPQPPAAPPGVPEAHSSNPSGRALRKRSIEKTTISSDRSVSSTSSKTRKKGNNSDGRWSKRFTWPDDLHRDFVSAIFDVGLKHASPSAVLEHMARHEAITSERIKSHLQKYRLHRSKSKKEFMTSYTASLSKFQADGLNGTKSLSSGEVAAHLSYTAMTDTDTVTGDEHADAQKEEQTEPKPEPPKPKDNSSMLVLPQLSEEEKKSPIGTSLGYLMGLFFSLRQQLLVQRTAQQAAVMASAKQPVDAITSTNGPVGSPVGTVFTHFASDGPENYHDLSSTWQTSHGPMIPGPNPVQYQDPIDPKSPPPSTLTNFQENKLMKQEMQNQLAFQNKMRGLKQRELNKYKSVPEHSEYEHKAAAASSSSTVMTPDPLAGKKDHDDHNNDKDMDDSAMSRCQGTGETAEAAGDAGIKGGRPRAMSEYNSEDFWNTDVVDEQLFEFLMNP